MTQRRALAIVGASESTLWTYWLMRNLREYAFPGEVWPVNPNRSTVYDTPCYPSVAALPSTPDIGVLITNPDRAVESSLALLERGTPELLVVSDGFRETARPDGIERERVLREAALAAGVRLVGPNCVGYASFHESLCAIAEPIPLGIRPGDVSVISQSGVLTHTALAALKDEGLGVDQCFSIGNGATFGFEKALDTLAARPTTKIVCAVVEAIRDHDALSDAVTRGREAGVEFVFLLLGQSEDGKRVAKSHTGAIIGDQRVMRAWLTGLGVTLVTSFEELTRAAALLRTVGRPSPERGVFILSNSGGSTGLAADTCAAQGLPLAQLSEQTSRKIREHLLPGTEVGNPLDITTHGGPEAKAAIHELICGDPSVGILIDPTGLSWPDDTDERRWHRAGMDTLVEAAEQAGVALIYTSLMGQPETDYVRRLAERPGICVNVGLATTISALARLYAWPGEATEPPATSKSHVDGSVVDEARARKVLEALGLPMVAGVEADSTENAVVGAAGLRAPWVAKVALRGLGHKGRIGGVRLGLCTADELAAACQDIVDAAVHHGAAKAEDVGFLVQEMQFGPELLVGLVRDPVAGPAAVIGVGGWAAEAGTVFGAVALPADKTAFAAALSRGGLTKLVPTDGLIDLLVDLSDQFTTGALRDYAVVECNPVILTAAGPRIADVLLVERDQTANAEGAA